MAWDQEYMERRIIWQAAHRHAMRQWIVHSRQLDPDSRKDFGEVVEAIRFEMGRGAFDGLDPEMVSEAIREGMVDRQPHW
jgi:hypothetical protein